MEPTDTGLPLGTEAGLHPLLQGPTGVRAVKGGAGHQHQAVPGEVVQVQPLLRTVHESQAAPLIARPLPPWVLPWQWPVIYS